MSKHIIVVNKIQLEKNLMTLCQEGDKVSLSDVLGVVNCCEHFLFNIDTKTATQITKSQKRRLEVQLQEN